MQDDSELLRRYADDQSESAFAELVRRHLNLVYSVALRQVAGDVHLAEDVTQKVFIALARKARALSGYPALSGWLYRSTHFAASDVVRVERRRRTREQEVHAMNSLLSDSAPQTDWDKVRPVLDAAISELDERDRNAVALRFLDGRSFADVGTKLGLSESAARLRSDRALDKLHAIMARRGVTSTASALGVALANQAGVAAPMGLAAAVTTGALSGAGVAITTGFLMSTTTAIVSAVAIAAVGAAAYQFSQVHRAEVEIASTGREHDSLRVQLRDSQHHAAQIEQQVVSLRQELDSVRAAKGVAPASTPTRAPNYGVTGVPGAGILTFTGPDGRTESSFVSSDNRVRMAEVVDSMYPALFRRLGWTPAQREQFTDLVAKWKEQTNELMGAAFAKGANPTTPEGRAILRTISDQTKADLQVAYRNAFGDADAEAIRRYDATLPMRGLADKLATALFYTDTPLTAPQAEQLVDIMANNARTAQGTIALSEMNSEAMFAQAQGVLSAPQVAAFRQLEAQRVGQDMAAKELAKRTGVANPASPEKK